MRYNINIIGGSTPALRGDSVRNVCHVFLRDGTMATQEKIHPTPNERYWWNITGGDELTLIDTDCGPIGVLICYDSEFPELSRHLVDQGINILFVPFLTDERQSYLPGALLRAGAGGREPDLRCHVGQLRQSAQCAEYRYSLCAELHPDAL